MNCEEVIKELCALRDSNNESYISIKNYQQYRDDIVDYCHDNDFDVYILFSGIKEYCCYHCNIWQNVDLKSYYRDYC